MKEDAPLVRCRWASTDPLLGSYHDAEWGVPERDPRALWEKLMLDGFQAGLAWITILRKREAFRAAFAQFEPGKVAAFDEHDVARLLGDAGIVRSRSKIEAVIGNARAYLAMVDTGEDFSALCWSFVDGAPIVGDGSTMLTKSPQSEALSTALKKRGFKFVGPVIVYAWMQACGLVDDHEEHCFRRQKSDTETRWWMTDLGRSLKKAPFGSSPLSTVSAIPARPHEPIGNKRLRSHRRGES